MNVLAAIYDTTEGSDWHDEGLMIMVMMAHLHNRGFLRAVGVLQFVEVIKRQARLLQPCKHSTQNTQQSNKLERST